MKEVDLMNEAPKINDLKNFLNDLSKLFEELNELEAEGMEKGDIIKGIIENARSELQKISGDKTIEQLPIPQQARIFADLFCLQSIFYDEMDNSEEDEESDDFDDEDDEEFEEDDEEESEFVDEDEEK